MIRLLVSVFALSLAAASARAQPSAVDSARTAWLASHLVVLDDTQESAGELLSAVEGARVVALGEPTHGDGTAFSLRNAITRALHEQAGFGLLLLEATGLYDLRAAFSTPSEAEAAVDSAASWVWRSSVEARPGLFYAASTAGSGRPLRLAGIDVQHGAESGAALLDDVERALVRAGALDGRWPDVRRTLAAAFDHPFAPVDRATQAATVQAAANYDRALQDGEERAALALRSALANALVPWTRTMDPRDRQMGETVVALAEREEGGAVVWSASSHAVRRLPAIDTMDPEWVYDGAVTMGDRVAQALGNEYYIVAFTACGGTYGAPAIGLEEVDIGPPGPGSLEALACSVPVETAAFLDLRGHSASEEGSWLSAPLVARPLGYEAQRASWPVVLDGLVIVRDMKPSTPYAP